MNPNQRLAFIGGGNMASAMVGGLLKRGLPPAQIQVLEPMAEQAAKLRQEFGVHTLAAPGPTLASAQTIVWAVKPQVFQLAAAQIKPHVSTLALHLSVAAGIRTDSVANWLASDRIVRAMPNTPALIGQGMTGLYARVPDHGAIAVSPDDLSIVEQLMDTTGQWLWVREEKQLDAVTALSGSGPAYVFYFLESMVAAGLELDLDPQTARTLALQTFQGASALAAQSSDSLAQLREKVTSKGGTTHAALMSMAQDGVDERIVKAIHAAAQRAKELGDEFGGA